MTVSKDIASGKLRFKSAETAVPHDACQICCLVLVSWRLSLLLMCAVTYLV